MGCDSAWYEERRQIKGGFSLWRKTNFSLRLVDEWLFWAQDERIITDMPNQCGKENYPGFIEHRHDQSIWSILCRRYQLEEFVSPPKTFFMYDRNSYYNPVGFYKSFRQLDPDFFSYQGRHHALCLLLLKTSAEISSELSDIERNTFGGGVSEVPHLVVEEDKDHNGLVLAGLNSLSGAKRQSER